MTSRLYLAFLALFLLTACRARRLAEEAPSSGILPANTIQLSAMMQQLSTRPGFTEAFLKEIQGTGARKGAALLTPSLIHHLREQILGRDWQGLDRFPGWTMREINPAVRVVGHEAAKDAAVDQSATAGGAPNRAIHQPANAFLDLGDLATVPSVDLDQPAHGPGFNASEYIAALGEGVTRGDGPDPERAPHHNQSARLANAFNRLALNGDPGEPPFTATLAGHAALTPEALLDALTATGHTITVADSRYFANFGHLHFHPPASATANPTTASPAAQDVMMPFWVNSQLLVPHTNRPLLVPVSHAEYEWFIRGPQVNAEVSFYFGIDGKAQFRTMDQLDQSWVMNRHAHVYRGAQAREVTRLAAAIIRTYLHLHRAHPAMPFGGYYAFGVCQDVVAAIELKLTGRTTLFPNTADASFFIDPADHEINTLIARIPKDRDGHPPQPERIFGSLPVGDSAAELAMISIPGLAGDLIATHAAWQNGQLEHVQTGWSKGLHYAENLLAFIALLAALAYANKRSRVA